MIRHTLPLDQACPGMKLAAHVRDDHDVTLPAAASVLTEVQLDALRQQGVSQIIVAEADMLPAAEQEAQREAIRVRLAHLFRHTGKTEANRLLYEIMLDYRLEQPG